MKIRRVRSELFDVDGQIYMTKLIVTFRIFADAPNIRHIIIIITIIITTSCN
jgi:hypothetical protein